MSERPADRWRLEPDTTLPPLHEGRCPTRLICPECGGVITAEVVGRHYLHFTCRVGHAYALAEFLADKERSFEAQLWRTVYLAEELASLLGGLEEQGWRPGMMGEATTRQLQLAEHVRTLRALIDRDQPLMAGDLTAPPEVPR